MSNITSIYLAISIKTSRKKETGGWCSILNSDNGSRACAKGVFEAVSTAQMQLITAIKVLEDLPKGSTCTIAVADEYIFKGITLWIKKWRETDFTRPEKGPVKYADLWKKLDHLNNQHKLTWRLIDKKNLFGHKDYETAKQLARMARQEATEKATANVIEGSMFHRLNELIRDGRKKDIRYNMQTKTVLRTLANIQDEEFEELLGNCDTVEPFTIVQIFLQNVMKQGSL